jgi:hypothetical protein
MLDFTVSYAAGIASWVYDVKSINNNLIQKFCFVEKNNWLICNLIINRIKFI